MPNGFFHCKVIDSVAVALQVDSSDPVTPISQADFVTGSIVNPLQVPQSPFLYKYTGTQSNGSVDGTMDAVDNQVTSLKARLIMGGNIVDYDSFTLKGSNPTVTTTDATTTNIGNPWEVQEGKRLFITTLIDAERTDSLDLYNRALRYVIYREVGGSAIIDDEDQYYKNGPNSIKAELILSGNNIQGQVTGLVGQTWNWRLVEFNFDIEDLD